jgi:hypothetical protein
LIAATHLQLRVYALLAARCYGVGPTGISVTILQPRMFDPDGYVRSIRYTADDLEDFEAKLRGAVAATQTPDAPRIAGSWCRFCAARAHCPERLGARRAGLGESLAIDADLAV